MVVGSHSESCRARGISGLDVSDPRPNREHQPPHRLGEKTQPGLLSHGTLSDLYHPYLQATKAKFRIVVAPRPQPGYSPSIHCPHCPLWCWWSSRENLRVRGGGFDGGHHWLACYRTRKSGSKSDVTDDFEIRCGWLMHGCASPPHHSICLCSSAPYSLP